MRHFIDWYETCVANGIAGNSGKGLCMMSYRFGLLAAFGATLMLASPASAGVFSSYSCNTSFTDCSGSAAVSGGNFDLKSSTTGLVGASGLQFTPSGTLAVSGLTALSAVYDMTAGTFTGGAPRFTLFDGSNNAAYIYWGTPTGGGSFSNPNPNGVFASTGNYADLSSPDVRVYSNGFGGDNNPNTGVTFSTFEGLVGSTDISNIFLDLDAGFAGNQELLVSSFTVNNSVDTASPVPEPLTLSLFGAGFAGLVAMRRKKAKA